MNPEQENFDALRKLLALKRHEIPPPGYFDHLPRRISTRLHANEGSLSLWESLVDWFHLNASMAYAFSLTACGALAVSIIYGARVEGARADAQPRDLAVSWLGRGADALASEASAPAHRDWHTVNWVANTNPASPSYELPSLFARPMQPAAIPTAYEAFSN
jgi:hypothetical protein